MQPSFHIVILVKDRNREGQYMLSTCEKYSSIIECIDVHRVHRIRFLIWLGINLNKIYNFGDTFQMVWMDVVVPVANIEEYSGKPPYVRHSAWV